MKKTIVSFFVVAVFALVALFGMAGQAEAVAIKDSVAIDAGTDNYACALESGIIECWKNVGGSVTKFSGSVSTAVVLDIVGTVKVGATDLQVYYNHFNFASPGVINLKKAVFNTTTGAVTSDADYLSDYGGVGAISKEIPSGATNPAIAWLDKTTGDVKIDIDGTVDTTGSTSDTPATAGTFIDVYASTATDVVAVTYRDTSGDFNVNNYDTGVNTDNIILIDGTYIPAYQDIVGFDPTYDKAMIAFQDDTDKDIYYAYSADGTSYTNTSLVSLAADVEGFAAAKEGSNVAIAYTTTSDLRAVVVDETASVVRADTSIDNSYTDYGVVDIDQNASSRAVIIFTGENAGTFSLDEFAWDGATTWVQTNFEQQGGGAVPELPANNLWKVLIAVLALGLVVGIAAFMKKKKK